MAMPPVLPPAAVPPAVVPPAAVAASPSSGGLSWHGPGRAAPPAVLGGALVTAVVAAIVISWTRAGVGWLLTALVGAAVAVFGGWAARRQDASATRGGSALEGAAAEGTAAAAEEAAGRRWPVSTFWAALAVTLIAVGTFRSATWLWALCLPTAVICGTLALAGVGTLRGMVLGFVTFPAAVVRSLPWTVRGLAATRGRSGGSLVRIMVSVLVGLVLLVVFGSLLTSADAAFGKIINDIVPPLHAATVFGGIVSFGFLGLGTLGAAFLAAAQPTLDGGLGGRGRLRPVEWGIPVGALVLLFGGFVAVQGTYLFGGQAVVLRTANLTAAEYARGGFAQLVVVTVLTLIVTGLAARLAARQTVGQRATVRVLLGLLVLLTLSIVVSALTRMWNYQDAFGLTRLRLVVGVVEIWLGLVFVLVLAAGARLTRPATWVPGAAAGLAGLALLGLAVLNPDRFVAERNIDRYHATGQLDLDYLMSLSPDALPAFDQLDGLERQCARRGVWAGLGVEGPYLVGPTEPLHPDPWREWNLARARARAELAGFAPPPNSVCDDLASGLDPGSR